MDFTWKPVDEQGHGRGQSQLGDERILKPAGAATQHFRGPTIVTAQGAARLMYWGTFEEQGKDRMMWRVVLVFSAGDPNSVCFSRVEEELDERQVTLGLPLVMREIVMDSHDATFRGADLRIHDGKVLLDLR